MICYGDRTFCKFYEECKYGEGCERALTVNVMQEAYDCGLPVCQFMEKPECFKEACNEKTIHRKTKSD